MAERRPTHQRVSLALGFADQGAMSAGMLLLSIGVFRSGTPREVAEVSIALVVYSLAVGIARSLTSEVVSVQSIDFDRSVFIQITKISVLRVLAVTGLVMVIVALSVGVHTEAGALALAAGALATCVDVVRTTAIAMQANTLSAGISFFGLAGICIGLCICLWFDDATPLVATWLVSLTLVLGFLAALAHRSGPPLSAAQVAWHPRYLWEAIVTTGSSQIAILVGSAWLGAEVASIARLGATLFGPYFVLLQASALLAVPRLVRWRIARENYRDWHGASAVSGALSGLICAWFILLILANRTGIGTQILGKNWELAQSYTALMFLGYLGGAISAGPLLALRASGAKRRPLILRSLAGAAQLLIPLVLYRVRGIHGYFEGVALAGVLVATAGILFVRSGEEWRGEDLARQQPDCRQGVTSSGTNAVKEGV